MPATDPQSNFGSGRMATGHAKSGYRVVHVAVPNDVFNHAKAQAFMSNMKWQEYITRLLSNAEPLNVDPAGHAGLEPS